MNTRAHITGTRARAAAALALIAAGAALPACRGDRKAKPPRQFLPDMDDQYKWKPQQESEFFADGRTMRQPVAGTVAFGGTDFVSEASWAAPFMAERTSLLAEDDALF